mgnify:CR=1 FL=1
MTKLGVFYCLGNDLKSDVEELKLFFNSKCKISKYLNHLAHSTIYVFEIAFAAFFALTGLTMSKAFLAAMVDASSATTDFLEGRLCLCNKAMEGALFSMHPVPMQVSGTKF